MIEVGLIYSYLLVLMNASSPIKLLYDKSTDQHHVETYLEKHVTRVI